MSDPDRQPEHVPGFVHTTVVPDADCDICKGIREVTSGETVSLCLKHAYRIAMLAAQSGMRPYSLAESQAVEIANRAWAAWRGPQ